jgi:hypothetical protein
MITLPGQLAIKTIHGRNGDFNVGRLATSIGEFVIKNAELDQYREGKYEGDFVITEIRPSTYTHERPHGHRDPRPPGRHDLVEHRSPEPRRSQPAESAGSRSDRRGSAGTCPVHFGTRRSEGAQRPAIPWSIPSRSVWTFRSRLLPSRLGPGRRRHAVRCTLAAGRDRQARCHRRSSPVLRQQRDRLGALGYEFAPLSQDWHLQAA